MSSLRTNTVTNIIETGTTTTPVPATPIGKIEKVLQRDLPKSILRVFKGLTDVQAKKDFLTMYSYVQSIASSLDVTIDEEEYHKFLVLEKFCTKQEINKILFQKVSDKEKQKISFEKNKNSGLKIEFSDKTIKSISEKGILSSRKQTIKNAIINNYRNIEDYQNTLNTYIRKNSDLQQELNLLKDDDKPILKIKDEFNKIADMDMDYQNVYFDEINLRLHAVTKQDCILKDPYDKEAGEVNFGKFDIIHDLTNGYLYVIPFENNISAGEYYHPHVYSHGGMCYGSASASIGEYMAAKDYANMYNLINLILHNYNPDSPIRVLNEYRTLLPYYYDRYNRFEGYWHKENINIFPNQINNSEKKKISFSDFLNEEIRLEAEGG